MPPCSCPRKSETPHRSCPARSRATASKCGLNTTVVNVRMEGSRKLADLISDDYTSTVAVDAILTGVGRAPNVEDMGLETASVDYDPELGIRTDDFLQTSNPCIYAAGDVCLEH